MEREIKFTKKEIDYIKGLLAYKNLFIKRGNGRKMIKRILKEIRC